MVSKRASSKMCRVVRPASPACKVRLNRVESETGRGYSSALRNTSKTGTSQQTVGCLDCRKQRERCFLAETLSAMNCG